MVAKLKRLVRRLLDRSTPVRDPETTVAEAAEYWAETDSSEVRVNAHWKGAGVFGDTARWERLGVRHLDLYRQLSGDDGGLGLVLEWGCGGGANVVAFGPHASGFIGVDVAPETLAEAVANASDAGVAAFSPVLIPVADPEAALTAVSTPIDLYLCTYVFELVPNRAYGADLLRIAFRMLTPGGNAFVQIRYTTDGTGSDRRRGRYRNSVAQTTTYGIEEFWNLAADVGFEPAAIHLLPLDELVDDGRYAYFLLTKPGGPVG